MASRDGKSFFDSLFGSQSGAIIVGSIIISISILLSGGIIKIKGLNPSGSLGSPSVAAPAQPTQPAAPGAPVPNQKATVELGHFPPKGDKNAKVAVVEFADLRCPFCEQYFTQTEPQILKDYVDTGKIKYAFRQYEFLGPASVAAGNAVECANEQGKFWEMHEYLYKNQPAETDTSLYTSDKLTPIAQSLGMDASKFKSCMDTTKYAKNVTDDQAAGTAAGVSGTPSFVIGKIGADGKVTGQLVVGAQPYASLKTAIDAALAQ